MKVIQVVKRFGLCGGMEEYVFRLTEELSKIGVKVKVLCEIQLTSTDHEITVIELGKSIEKPRWLSHIQFSNKVSKWVKNYAKQNDIVHSHERISCHHVTTIHSTLFNFPKKGLPSLRKYMNEYLEKREMNSNRIKRVVPVSHLISNELKVKFPFVKSVLNEPISPGVSRINCSRKKPVINMPIIGFISTYVVATYVYTAPETIAGGLYLVLLIVFLTPTANNVMVMVELASSSSSSR